MPRPDIRPGRILVTCEHGGNRVPRSYRAAFAGADAVLESHRGWDPGAFEFARALAEAVHAPLIAGRTTRLLIDLNRSLHHRRVFSEFTRNLDPQIKNRIVDRHYTPHRDAVRHSVAAGLRAGHRVVHIAAHSFVPVLDGDVRRADLGLLYDPRRRTEQEICGRWREALRITAPGLRVRRNYPYRGSDDGLTTALRREFGTRYCGIEVELNQAISTSARARRLLYPAIIEALECSLT